jgi:hypothetical protein
VADGTTFEGWVILELMGHRRLAGWLTEQEVAGAAFLRLDVPDVGTQYYSPSAVYCITPTSEETARQVATLNRPAPVHRWELPAAVVEECGACGAQDEPCLGRLPSEGLVNAVVQP